MKLAQIPEAECSVIEELRKTGGHTTGFLMGNPETIYITSV
jgi:hypothetical protein